MNLEISTSFASQSDLVFVWVLRFNAGKCVFSWNHTTSMLYYYRFLFLQYRNNIQIYNEANQICVLQNNVGLKFIVIFLVSISCREARMLIEGLSHCNVDFIPKPFSFGFREKKNRLFKNCASNFWIRHLEPKMYIFQLNQRTLRILAFKNMMKITLCFSTFWQISSNFFD